MQQQQNISAITVAQPQLLLDVWCVIFAYADTQTRMSLRRCSARFRTRFDSLRTSWTVHFVVITGCAYTVNRNSRFPFLVPEQQHYIPSRNAQHAIGLAEAWKQKPFGNFWRNVPRQFQDSAIKMVPGKEIYRPFQIDPSTTISLFVHRIVEHFSYSQYSSQGAVRVAALQVQVQQCTYAETVKLICTKSFAKAIDRNDVS